MNAFNSFKTQINNNKYNKLNKLTVTYTGSPIVTDISYNSITYKCYSFTITNPTPSYSITFSKNCEITYLVVGGGGSGGIDGGGGGGGGGVIYNTNTILANTYTISIGEGGATRTITSPYVKGNHGFNTTFGNYIAYGGGAGFTSNLSTYTDFSNVDGGSGGGTSNNNIGSLYVGKPGKAIYSVQGNLGNDGGEWINIPTQLRDMNFGAGGGGAGGKGKDCNYDIYKLFFVKLIFIGCLFAFKSTRKEE
jgi:hypothetical protein